MFESLFESKTKKLVHKWEKEHQKIVILATKVIQHYSKHEYKKAKEYLIKLNDVAIDHLMDEDIQLFILLHEKANNKPQITQTVKEFTESFRTTKITLMDFLHKYTKDDVELDEEFFETFNEIVKVLTQRIEFEENSLYTQVEEF